MDDGEARVPVLILGGQENTLSLARSFGRRKVTVNISAPADCLAFKSRFCGNAYLIPAGQSHAEFWDRLLLQDKPRDLVGNVVWAGSDEAVEYLAKRRDDLMAYYILDDATPALNLAMLNKCRTLELAVEAGCPVPAFHLVKCIDDITAFENSVMYPTMVKPVHSHLFRRHYPDRKYLVARNPDDLRKKVSALLALRLEMIVTEIVPGPDSLQSAYFTYVSRSGDRLFEYTHHILRRYPKNAGLACLTQTETLPATAAMGRRFFDAIGFTGMGHIEFKFDERDQRLKLIECNPRMSAAQAIVTKSGLDMAWRIYNYLLHGTLEPSSRYRLGVRRWWLLLDVKAFLELRKLGELSFVQWIKSIKGPPIVFPYFCLDDPKPFFYKSAQHLARSLTIVHKSLCRTAKESPIS